VIRNGQVEQFGVTADIFHRPQTTFVADFVGMKNIIPADPENGLWRKVKPMLPPGSEASTGCGYIALRPEEIHISSENNFPDPFTVLEGTVKTITREGFSWLAAVECDDVEIVARIDQRSLLGGHIEEGRGACIGVDPADLHYISDRRR